MQIPANLLCQTRALRNNMLARKILATKTRRRRAMLFEQLELRRLLIGSDWSNALSPLNVNADPGGIVSPLDALLIINELNSKQIADPRTGALPPVSATTPKPPPYFDVNCDRFVSPIDVLLVINDLNGGKTPLGSEYVNSDGTHGNYSRLGCGAVLREGSSLITSITTHLTVPADAQALSILLEGVEFDVTSTGRAHDAFEAALLDSSGKTLVHPLGPGDAFFNSTEAAASVGTSQVIVSGNRLTLSLEDVLPGTQADLVFRLVNNDSDTGTIAAIRSVTFQTTFPAGEGLKNTSMGPAPLAGPSAIPKNSLSNRPVVTTESPLPAAGVVTGRIATPAAAAAGQTRNLNTTAAIGLSNAHSDSRGTEFWIGFPDNLFEGNNRPQKALYITGDLATTGFVDIPGLIDPATSQPFHQEFIVNAGEVTVVELPSLDVGDNADDQTDFDVEAELIARVQHRGIHVVTNDPVAVYGLDLATATSDAFLALPVSSLGTEYLNLGYENTFASISHVEGTQFLVVATDDDTQVTLTPGAYTGSTTASSAIIKRPDGTAPFGLGNEAGLDIGPFVTDAAGSHSLTIKPPFDGYSGKYNFEVIDVATAAVPANLGEKIKVSFPTGRESRVVSFDVVAGQRLLYDAINPNPSPNVSVRLLSPSGQQNILSTQTDNNAFASNFGALQFTESGKYYVLIVGEQSAAFDFSFRMLDVDVAPKIAFGVDATGINDPAGRAAVYRVDGVAGQKFYFDSFVDNRLVTYYLYGPGGSIVASRTASDDHVTVFPETGTYIVYLDSASFATSSFGFRLVDLHSLPVLSTGTTTSAHIEGGLSVGYRFSAAAAQTLTVDFQSVSLPGRTLYTLLDPAGNEVTLATSGTSLSAGLLTAGEYSLLLKTVTNSEVSDVVFTASLASDPVVTKSGFNSQHTLTIAAGGSATYQFSAPAGTRILIDSLDTANENLNIEFKAPDGRRLFDNFQFFGELQDIPRFDPALLPQSGTYTLTLRGNTVTDAGSYTFRVLDLDSFATPLSLDTVINGDFPTGREARVYSFDATVGDQLNFDGLSGSYIFGIYDAQLNAVYSRGIFGAASTAEVDGLARILRTGRHYVLLHGDPSIPPNYSFQLQDLSLAPDLPFGVEATGSVPGNGQVAYRMSLTAGQRVRLDNLLPFTDQINFRVANAGGRVLFSSGFQNVDSGPPGGPFLVVAETGQYYVSVQSRQTAPANYRFRIDDLASAPPLSFNGDVEVTLEPGNSAKVFRIDATAGETIQFDNLGSFLPLNWGVTGPVNQSVGSSNDGSDFSATVPISGTYYLTISGRQDSGPVTLRFQASRTPGPVVSLAGVNTLVNLDVGLNETKSYTFSAPTGRLVYVNVLKSQFAIPTHTVTLNRGETYLLRDLGAGTFTMGADLTGSVITSTKPVAVFGGNRATFIPNEFFAADHLVEQLPPTSTWGKEFVTVPLATGTTRGDRFRFLAQADNTQVTVNGTLAATLNRGQFFEQIIVGSAQVLSNQPILVAQYAHSQNFYRATPGGDASFLGDPLMMIVPPFEQFLASYTISTPVASSILTDQRFDRNFINIAAPADAVGQIEINGSAIDASLFLPIGTSGFYGAQVPVEPGGYRLDGPLPFGVFVYGFGSFDSYGYVGGQSLSPVAQVSSVLLTPAAASREINDTLTFTARVADVSGIALEGIRVDFDVAGVNPQRGFGFSDANGLVQFSYVGASQGRDVVTASVGTLLDDSIVDWQGGAAAPTISVSTPLDGSRVPAGTTLVASGFALADFPNATLDLITVNGAPIEAVDAAGNFFVALFVGPGENQFEFTAIDSEGQSVSQTITIAGDQSDASSIDFTSFADVSGSFLVEYARTSYNQYTRTLYAETSVKNAGQFPADVPLLVAITNISDPGILVRDADGVTPDGDPYYDFSGLVDGGGLAPQGQSGFLSTAFFNPNQVQFTYDLVFLGKLNEAPQITSLPITNVDLGREYTYQVRAVDPNGDAITYALLESPASMSIDSASGLIRWTPTSADAGVSTIEVQVADGRLGVSTQRYSLTVQVAPANRTPVFTSLPVGLAEVGVDYPYVAQAIDADEDALTFGLVSAPSGMTVTADTGVIHWRPSTQQLGVQQVTLEVADGHGGVSRQAFALIVTSPAGNRAPVIVSSPPTAANVGQFTYQVLALDADGESLSYRLANAPAGMTIDHAGLIQWSTTTANLGAHPVVVQVLDPRGGMDQQSFTLTLFANQSPSITSLPEVSAQTANTYSYQVIATDVDDDILTFQLLEAPAGMTLHPATGLIQWNVPTSAFAQERVSVRVADGRGGSAIQRFTIQVAGGQSVASNITPYFVSVPPTSASVGTKLLYTAVARDPNGDALTYDLPLGPAGMTIDPTTGQLGWLPRPDQVGIQQIVIRVSDGSNNWLQSFPLRVDASNTAPVITSTPNTSSVVAHPWEYRVQAQDADGDLLSFELLSPTSGMTLTALQDADADAVLSVTAVAAGSVPVVLAVRDTRGGVSEQRFTLQIVDVAANVAPVVHSSARTQVAAGQTWFYMIEASDPDADPLSIELTDSPNGMVLDASARTVSWVPSLDQLGSQAVTLTLSDGRGGTTLHSFSVDVTAERENQAPRIVSPPPAFRATVGQPFEYNLRASDADNDPVEWTLVEAPHGTSLDRRLGTLRWTASIDQTGFQRFVISAKDPAGQESLQSFSLLVSAANLGPMILSRAPSEAFADERYVYGIRAIDPENDVLNYTLVEAPAGMTIDAARGIVRWTPTAGQLGTAVATVEVSDAEGNSSSQTFPINVAQAVHNKAPVITSRALFKARLGAEYRYDVAAFDPEDDALTYSLLEAPDGMQINALTGLITWTPATLDIGAHLVRVAVADTAGNVGLQRFSLQARANQAPIITSSAPTTGALGSVYRYDVQVSDSEQDPLEFQLAVAPAGMTIDSLGRIRWATAPGVELSNPVLITVRDAFGAVVTQSYTLAVTPDAQGPVVELQLSANPLALGEDSVVVVRASDDVGVVDLVLSLDGVPQVLDANNSITLRGQTAGLHALKATARDTSGNIGTAEVSLRVFDSTDTQGPVITVTAPASSAIVTSLTDIIGSVTDDNLQFYRVDYGRVDLVDINQPAADDPDYTTLATSNLAAIDAVLATFDPTKLNNDEYVIRILAVDLSGNVAAKTLSLGLEGQLKLGEFELSFVDLSVPVAGIPLTVTRSYDTRNASETQDFGYGWTLSVSDPKIRESIPTNPLEVQGLYYAATPFRDGTRVYLTNPAGQRVGFTFKPQHQFSLFGGGSFSGTFLPDPGVNDKLDVGGVTLRQINGAFYNGFDGSPFNPSAYRLTTKDGTVYEYGQFSGLDNIHDRNDNRIDIRPDGIFSSSGPSIRFIRDPQGRITQIIDPAGNALKYAYDRNGDLSSFTDQVGLKTAHSYFDSPEHYLRTVIDANGNTEYVAQFDAQGNLSSVSNAAIGLTQITSDLDSLTESVTDPEGRTTTFTYDDNGDLISVTNDRNATTTFEYDANHNITASIDPLGHRATRKVDSRGNTIESTDALGSTYTLQYNEFNLPTSATDPLGRTTTNVYDDRGQLIGIIDAAGNRSSETRDSQGRVLTRTDRAGETTSYEYGNSFLPTKITNPDGTTLQATYNAFSEPLTHVDENGNTRTSVYDAAGRLLKETDGLGHATLYQYDGVRLASVTNPLGETRQYLYDSANRRIGEIDPLGQRRSFEYNSQNRLTAETDPSGAVTRFTYGPDGYLATFTDAVGKTATYAYDLAGNTTSVTDALGRSVRFEYDAKGRLIRESDPLGGVRQYHYDAVDKILAVTDENGHTTRYSYDALNGLVKVEDALGGTVITAYDANDNLRSSTDANGNTTRFEYDSRHRRITQIDPAGGTQHFEYDGVGNLISTTDEKGNVTRYFYDAGSPSRLDDLGRNTAVRDQVAGRLVRVVRPNGATQGYAYDAAGNLASEVDEIGRTTRYTYDVLGRSTKIEYPDGGHTLLEYDAVGNTTSIADPNGNVTRFTYNAIGQVLSDINALGKAKVFTYDGVGNQQSITDRNGRVREFAYDAKGRMLSENWLEAGTVTRTYHYSYDAAGNMTSASDPDSSLAFTYDAVNERIQSKTLASANLPELTLNYEYDAAGNMLATTDNLGTSVGYTYDSRNLRATQSWTVGGSQIAAVGFHYDPHWDRDKLTRFAATGNVIGTTTYARNSDYRTTSVVHRNASDNVIADYNYAFDQAGQLIDEVNRGDAVHYTYDALGQLLDANRANLPDEGYTYDPGGNRLSANSTGYVVGANNHTQSDGQFDYAFDDAGNIVAKTEVATGITTSFAFDLRNRLTSVEARSAAGVLISRSSYTYDALDHRIGVSTGGSATFTIYDGDRPWVDFAPGGSPETKYLSGPQVDEVFARYRAGEGLTWYLQDRLGTIGDLADATGAVVDHLEYDSFGKVTQETAPARGDRFRFTGREFDAATGLYYYRARYYDPALGKFMSEDPLGFFAGDTNLSRYVGNQPNGLIDPYGKQAVVEFGGLLGAVGVLDDYFLAPGTGSASIKINGECVTFCATTQVLSLAAGDIGAQNAANYGEAALVLQIIDDYVAKVVATNDLEQTVEINDINRMEGPLLWTQQARISVEAGSGLGDAVKGVTTAEKLARFVGIKGPTICKKCSSLRIPPEDLVYGPSAGGQLRAFQETHGGKLLNDFTDWLGKSAIDFSTYQLDEAVKAGNKIHFDLTYFDPNYPDILKKVTGKELLYIECNWKKFKDHIIFYDL